MRIGMLFFYLDRPAGNVAAFLALANEFLRQGHQVDVFCYYYNPTLCFPDRPTELAIHYIKKSTQSHGDFSHTSLKSRLSAALDFYLRSSKLAQQLERYDFDVLYCSESCTYPPALRYVQKKQIPVVWSVFDPITLIDKSKPQSTITKHSWFKKILTLHNLYDAHLIRKLSAVIVPTQKMKQDFDSFYGIEAICLPLAGIEPQVTQQTQKLAAARLFKKFGYQKKDQILLLTQAHFQVHRRFEDILYALAELKKNKYHRLTLVISGKKDFDEKYSQKIVHLVKVLGLESEVIIDSEYKTSAEVQSYYQLCDVFLFVCVAQTWGLAPLEAAVHQKPIVISTGVGCVELFRNGETAYVVAEKNPREIVKALENILKHPAMAQKIGYAANKELRQEISYPVISHKVIKLFQQLQVHESTHSLTQ